LWRHFLTFLFFNQLATMQTYITQLIEELHASQINAQHVINKQLIEENFEAHMADVEHYLSNDGAQPIYEIIGLLPECFPPATRLNENQLTTVSSALLECLSSWNICIDLPEKLPAALAYTLLVKSLQDKIVVQNSGVIHLELCHYDSEDCPFGTAYCRCMDSEDDHVQATAIL
jgi:hypothetical protein